MNRRQFLRGAAALGGATAIGARLPTWAQSDGPESIESIGSILNHPAGECPVDTIVVLMMENRSFDHYFGWLPGDEHYMESGRSRYGASFTVDGLLDQTYLRPDGTAVTTYHLNHQSGGPNPYRGCGHPDPGHGWDSGRAQRDAGFLADGSGNDEYALGYYLEPDLPAYGPLARSFTIFDRYHCSLLASTYPNRWYMHSAQSNGIKDNYLPVKELGFKESTIWDNLVAARVPCAYYGTDLPATAFWGPRLVPVTRSIAQFLTDCALGTLPRVAFVDPGFLSGMRTDDHPHGDMRMGQLFVASIMRSFQSSPHWERGALFVNYDEWGGFADHVAPPVLADDRQSADDAENFGQAGFRLPVMLASPYARPGYVDHRLYDHTSILRFIEWRFLGAPAEGPGCNGWWLTARDRAANNIGAALVDRRVNDRVLDPAAVKVNASPPCQGQYFQDVPGADQLENEVVVPVLDALNSDVLDEVSGIGTGSGPLGLFPPVGEGAVGTGARVGRAGPDTPDGPFADALEAGMFDYFGYRTDPSIGLRELLDL